MCGIAVVISRSGRPIDRELISAMTEVVSHRGPDDSGYYFAPGLAMGHRRLAIIDLSPLGRQPMEYLDRYVIVHNGEVYNYRELRRHLETHGYAFRSQTDTEVIAAAYDHWGEGCTHHFNGMWAFVIYDRRQNRLFCSRDRFGVKPLYYAQIGEYFCLTSEIKQFTVLDGWRARINRRRAREFLLSALKNHAPETLFEGVFQLGAGHNLVYDLKAYTHTIGQWYHVTAGHTEAPLDTQTAGEKFRELFTDAVRLRLRSDVKVGSCLSGGLDSSSIVGVVNRLLRQENAQARQETVSSCFELSRYDERPFIAAVAEKTGVISHRVFPRFDDLFEKLDRIIWHQDEPFVSTSIFAQWEVFRTAAENGITVMLDGQGADEILGGYDVFHGKYLARLLRTGRLARALREINCSRRHRGHSAGTIARMMLGNGAPSFLRRAFRNLTPHKLAGLIDDDGLQDRSEPWRLPTRTMTEESLAEIRYTHLPILLHYEDRNSMAFGIEARVPFLDYRLAEFVLGLPDDLKMRDGATKFILREAMADVLPEMVRNRYDKMGFVTPEEIWMRENAALFRQELEDTLELSRGWIKPALLEWHEAVVTGRRPFDFTIWRFIAFGRWLRVFDVDVERTS